MVISVRFQLSPCAEPFVPRETVTANEMLLEVYYPVAESGREGKRLRASIGRFGLMVKDG